GEGVFLDEFFGDDDGVFEVVAVIGHEGDEDVFAQGQFAIFAGGAVGNDLAFLDALAEGDQRLLREAGLVVEAGVLAEDVFVGVVDDDALGIAEGHDAGAFGLDDHAGVGRHVLFHAGADDRGLGDQYGHRLAW